MKQVFETSEIAHLWANQSQQSARNPHGNLYFEGATIYSYGRHFPIATIEGNDVLLTQDTYSHATSKHVNMARSAISHKNIIWCYEVPVKWDEKPLNKQSLNSTHEKNLTKWKNDIKRLFSELGNKKIRDTQSRINGISQAIKQINTYRSYFNIKLADKELKQIFADFSKPAFIEIARKATEKQTEAIGRKMKQATKAYEAYISLWRKFDTEGLQNLPEKTKDLIRFYSVQSEAFTRLRFNTEENRVETSKGVQIPVEIAKKAYIQLNGCMEGVCEQLTIPVLGYTITKTTKAAIIAGCHTIPKEDVKYIAELLKW